jgi:hypothetical protein
VGIEAKDLPAAVRARLAELNPAHADALAGATAAKGARPNGRADTKGGRWTCHACGEPFTTWAAVERHRDELGHVRFDLVLAEVPR